MKKMFYLVLVFLTVSYGNRSHAADLIVNGSFETGNFTGWTATNPASAWRLWAVSASGAGGDDGSGYTPVPTATVVQHGTRSAWNGVTAGANTSFVLSQDVTIPAGQTASVQWVDRYQLNYTQFCGSGANPCGTGDYFVEILNTSNVLQRTLYTVHTANNTNSNTGYVTHYVLLGTAFAGQTIRLRFRTLVSNTLEGPGQVEIDNVRLNAPAVLNPSAAGVMVDGRILSNDGRGIAGTAVSLTAANGTRRNAITSSLGYYHFEDVETGGTYIIAVVNKRYLFPDSPRVVVINDQLSELNFTAIP